MNATIRTKTLDDEMRRLACADQDPILQFAVCHKSGGHIDGCEHSETTLIGAIINDNYEIARYIIENDGNLDARAYDRDGLMWTALMWCILRTRFDSRSVELAYAMIDKGADLNLVDSRGHTALAYAAWTAEHTHPLFDYILERMDEPCNAVGAGRYTLDPRNLLFSVHEHFPGKERIIPYWRAILDRFPGEAYREGEYDRDTGTLPDLVADQDVPEEYHVQRSELVERLRDAGCGVQK